MDPLASLPFTLSTLRNVLGAMTVAKGQSYLREGRVREAVIEPSGEIRGLVRGTRTSPYVQHIGVTAFVVEGHCSCPVGWNCKHVAAVLLKLLTPSSSAKPSLEPFAASEDLPVRKDKNLSQWLREIDQALLPSNEFPPEINQRLFYLLNVTQGTNGSTPTLELISMKILRTGQLGARANFNAETVRSGNIAQYVRPIDTEIVSSLLRNCSRLSHSSTSVFSLSGKEGVRHLRMAIETDRCYWGEPCTGSKLWIGEARTAKPVWNESGTGTQAFEFAVDNALAIALSPPWYVDRESGECGEAITGMGAAISERLMKMPPVATEHSHWFRGELEQRLPIDENMLPKEHKPPEIRHVRPVPCLTVQWVDCSVRQWSGSGPKTSVRMPMATLEFDYEGSFVKGPGYGDARRKEGDAVIIMPREEDFERECQRWLGEFGWIQTTWAPSLLEIPKDTTHQLILAPDVADLARVRTAPLFYSFLQGGVADLRAEGWRVNLLDSIDFVAPEELRWEGEASQEEGIDWFGLKLGIVVQGEKIDLLPILIDAFRVLNKSGKPEDLDNVQAKGTLYHEMRNGRVVSLPVERLKPLLKALLQLYADPAAWDQIRIPKTRLAELVAFEQFASDAKLVWKDPQHSLEVGKKLAGFQSVRSIKKPKLFDGDLRPYQLHGLSWLQFLREYGFGGILADDMGLGKTVQTLAHIAEEKASGRLDRPALVIAPTSTMPNWQQEAARFTPCLKVLLLHGPSRKDLATQIRSNDLVLTTYPLLVRDKEMLLQNSYHLIVLDEAQNIKNPTTSVAKTAFSLEARHRVCLSGTPIENNLEELWSIFHFLMPGHLGNLQEFRREFRAPIEQKGSQPARERLAKRVRPFMLRRKKDQVVLELPPKTEIIERIELDGPQRDLYESLRLAMDKRVRELVTIKGVSRSQIEILDALLKVRQVCCDPRLVKLPAAKDVKDSAKLERLIEMLGELLEEGRRVLVFSQFTSMLDLIEERLKQAKIQWVRISGDTTDRATPVKQFQSGSVPVFLISLKAGGTGLNLTAADTVIHYDPWWNPAVERQATDRAHRIGQDKAVFVYKLVATDTVEEKMLELQQRKAVLAEGILEDAASLPSAITAEDLKWIFE